MVFVFRRGTKDEGDERREHRVQSGYPLRQPHGVPHDTAESFGTDQAQEATGGHCFRELRWVTA